MFPLSLLPNELRVVTKVNVLTGKKGWHKRVNKSTTQMKRSAELTDGPSIDPSGNALDKMESATKKAVFKSIKIAHAAPHPLATASVPATWFCLRLFLINRLKHFCGTGFL